MYNFFFLNRFDEKSFDSYDQKLNSNDNKFELVSRLGITESEKAIYKRRREKKKKKPFHTHKKKGHCPANTVIYIFKSTHESIDYCNITTITSTHFEETHITLTLV